MELDSDWKLISTHQSHTKLPIFLADLLSTLVENLTQLLIVQERDAKGDTVLRSRQEMILGKYTT